VGIPFTSVIEQTAQVYRDALAPNHGAILEHHSSFDQSRIEGIQARSKLALAMETWDQPLIVTTTVRLFESLFSNRPSQCRKLHNLARSVIVLDEVQTLPLTLLRPCVAALKELAANYGCSIVLCTATQPALLATTRGRGRPFTDGFEDTIELAPDPPGLFDAMRRVQVEEIGEQTDDQLAERLAQADQALCIVNRRAHAQALYGAISHLDGARHLSTLMCAEHRRAVLTEIREDLKAERRCRVISTSLIEAGVDVDFPLVLRAEAGLDSILQAAGRCNREGRRDREDSKALVFRPADGKRLQAMRAHIETSETVFRRFGADVTRLEAVSAYFAELLHRKGDDALDEKGILRACQDRMLTLDFPFATIAEDFQMIDDYSQAVIIEWDGRARRTVERLRHLRDGFTPGGLARELQSYTVGVPPKARIALIASGAAEVIDEARFGDQFVLLVNADLYRSDIGLSWEDPALMDAERLVV
jgi:CRISPR-associated endonuclease/helicase Cas3